MEQQQKFELGPRWTKEILQVCTPRELLVIVSAYGAEQVARRMGYVDVAEFARERAPLLLAKE